MAESQTFYLSYAPALEVLQNRDYVPFKDFLVFPDPKQMEPAEYINQIKSPPDWGIIFQRDSLPERSIQDEHSEKYSLLEDFDKLRLNSSYKPHLDESQLAAVELALRNKLVLIQGPPGTGKSYVGVALVNLLLSMKVPHEHGPILVVTYKNHALDNFMEDCIKKVSPDVKIVRVGRVGEDASEALKKCLLRQVGRQWPQRLFNQKRKLSGKIWALQPEVERAFEKLRYSSSFTADMFLKEAPRSLLKSLLIGSQQIKEAELDDLIKERPRTETRLKEMIQKALLRWLPSQELFNSIAQTMVNEKGSLPENSSPGKGKGKQVEDQGQAENPSDVSDPSVEKNERFLAIDEEITDDDDKVIAADLKSQASGSTSYILRRSIHQARGCKQASNSDICSWP